MSNRKPEDIQGLWCRKDNSFYWLDTGPIWNPNNTDRLRKILVAKELIEFSIEGTKRGFEPYLLMTMADAKAKNYECKTIYINAHVKRVAEQSKVKETVSNPWDKR